MSVALKRISHFSVQEVSDNITLVLNHIHETDIRGTVLTFVHRVIAKSLVGIDTSQYDTDKKPAPLNRFFSQVDSI